MRFEHPYPFDPTYGYRLDQLLSIEPPEEPLDFESFWLERYSRALAIAPAPVISPAARLASAPAVTGSILTAVLAHPLREGPRGQPPSGHAAAKGVSTIADCGR